jgi:hypothetical protein
VPPQVTPQVTPQVEKVLTATPMKSHRQIGFSHELSEEKSFFISVCTRLKYPSGSIARENLYALDRPIGKKC